MGQKEVLKKKWQKIRRKDKAAIWKLFWGFPLPPPENQCRHVDACLTGFVQVSIARHQRFWCFRTPQSSCQEAPANCLNHGPDRCMDVFDMENLKANGGEIRNKSASRPMDQRGIWTQMIGNHLKGKGIRSSHLVVSLLNITLFYNIIFYLFFLSALWVSGSMVSQFILRDTGAFTDAWWISQKRMVLRKIWCRVVRFTSFG